MDKFEFSFNGDTMQASLVRIFGRYVLEVTEADSNKFVDVFSLPKYYSGSNSSLFFLLTEAAGEITKNITFNTLTGQPVEDMKQRRVYHQRPRA